MRLGALQDMNALHADNGGGFEDEVMEKYGLSVCLASGVSSGSLLYTYKLIVL